MICVIFAHPYPGRSRANRALAGAIRDLPGVDWRSLYERYPDFDIDTAVEQEALRQADLVVWMHPLYWYGVPGMLKHWFEKVLTAGWAYGEGGTALHGKSCLWVTTTGGDAASYAPQGMHGRPFAEYVAPVEQTARFCGMRWEPPFVVHGAEVLDDAALAARAEELRRRIEPWLATAAER